MSPIWLAILWPWALFTVAIYFLIQIVRDWRRGNYLMAIVGGVWLTLLALTPIPPTAVKVDVPTRT